MLINLDGRQLSWSRGGGLALCSYLVLDSGPVSAWVSKPALSHEGIVNIALPFTRRHCEHCSVLGADGGKLVSRDTAPFCAGARSSNQGRSEGQCCAK